MNTLGKLLNFLNKLDELNIYYKLDHTRPETILVDIRVPGEWWEVEFTEDGEIEVEIFKGGEPNAPLEGEEALTRFFEEHAG